MSAERVVLRISKEAMKVVRGKAETDGVELGQAADNLITGAPSTSKLVTAEQLSEVKVLAGKLGKTVPETMDRLIKMGLSRHKALGKYAKAQLKKEK